ncbi:hypothetical protein GPJ56_000739 [Histomonas meleagridis]|uniref:uncharacterized protein n=1 Tax=Histomonas meleagridis TaxID=135588 RepID=UPI003559DB38|nr:hypothetical protein GPJ56_000739 [Histomonas meleagridis]KAH0804502.1 hypothetical protein GO595_003332 [Histomonas meleagridis]
MIYNFSALDDEEYSQNSDEYQDENVSDERKKAKIKELEAIRDQKRKELFLLKQSKIEEDEDHKAKVREISKQIVNLSKQVQDKKKEANDLEIKLKQISPQKELPLQEKPQADPRADLVRKLRSQNSILLTDIQKAKRVLANEGGCKNRALKIKKLRSQIEEISKLPNQESESFHPKSTNPQPLDPQTLRREIGNLKRDNDNMKLKLKGLQSRISTLEKSEMKSRIKNNLIISDQNDELIERLAPKQQRTTSRKQYRAHIGQQSRLSVVINGLHAELYERREELNHCKVQKGENGIRCEIDRLLKRLQLLESSLSCII